MTRAILTCSPHFVELAVNEIRRHHAEAQLVQHLAPGLVLLQAPYSFDKLTAPWRQCQPIYLHHLFPVHACVADLNTLHSTIEQLAPPDATLQLRNLSQLPPAFMLPTNLPDTPTGRVLSGVITPDGCAYLGVSWASQNISPWTGGQMPITEEVPNRAGYKLLEALTIFGIHLRWGDHALDLGASPGAWTTLLRRRGLRVTAVASAPLYPWLAFDPDVLYQPFMAEDYLPHCHTTFDLIANDMILDAQDSARLMVSYAQHLRPGGIALMTLKLRQHNQRRVMDHAFRLLRKVYKIIQVRQLVHNRREVTLFLRRKG